MADTNFINGVSLSDADWFNDLNRLHYTIFGDPANVAAAKAALIVGYVSSGQTITAAGALTLAHGLGAAPTIITATLKCTSANLNYSTNDEVVIAIGEQSSSGADDFGVSVVPDATNLNIRFGSNAAPFIVVNKTTGNGTAIDITKWTIIFRAWRL